MMNTKNSWPREALWLTADALLILLLAVWLCGFRVNFTSSMPIGLYLLGVGPLQRSDMVAFCLPSENPFSGLARERGYLTSGFCPSGRQPLLKRLAGLPGDFVEIGEAGISLNGEFLPGTKRPSRDSRGRALPDSLLREGVIPNGLALLLSKEHDGGFDSRHFGLLSMSSLYQVKLLITFGKSTQSAQGEKI
jgi:conjugative transfer signal peptidase TraF